MWIKFDGKSNKVKIKHANWLNPKEFTFNNWVHIVETNDSLYLNEKEVKNEELPKI